MSDSKTAKPVAVEKLTKATRSAGSSTHKPFPWRFTAPLLLGSTLNPINSSMLATGLVAIGVDFHTGPGPTATLISVLYLCSAVAQPTMGKLSTLFGPRRVFVAGILILLAAGVVGTLAPGFGWLLLSRALIGIGTSAAYPTAMALVRRRADSLGLGVPSRVLGNFSIASQITAVIGLPLGGVLVQAFGWRALFAVNLPLAVVTLVFTLVGVAKDAPVVREQRGRLLAALDLPGILLFAGTIVTLLLYLSNLRRPVWWLLAVFVVVATALILWERHASRPLIDIRLLGRNGPLQRTYLRQTLAALGIYTLLYGLSQWMEDAAHISPGNAGLILIPFSAFSIVIARTVSTRGWIRWPLVIGGAAIIGSGVALWFLSSTSSVLFMIGVSLLLGLTNGFTGFANQACLYSQAPADEIAVASGLYRTFAYIGAIFSSSLLGLIFPATATDGGIHVLGWILTGLGFAVVALTLADRRIPVVAAT